MKKGIICAVIALMVVFSMAGFAAADANDKTDKIDSTVTHENAEVYVWTIPAALTVNTGANLKVTSLTIASGKKLSIAVKGHTTNGWNLVNNDDQIPFLISDGTSEFKTDNAVVLEVNAGTAAAGLPSKTITPKLDGTPTFKYSGTYTGGLTFSASVIDQSPTL